MTPAAAVAAVPPPSERASRKRRTSPDFHVETRFGLIYEDDHYLVLDKPAPLAVYPVGCYADLNLHSLVKRDWRWKDTDVRFAHRLDAETSGVILAAKSHEAARFAGIEFLKGRVKKMYRAVVFGVPIASAGLIDVPLGYDRSSGFQAIRVADRAGERAVTRWRLVSSDGAYSELDVEPVTGRTHQIRVHLSLIGHPIVGDKIYVDPSLFPRYVESGIDAYILSRIKLPRLALHAKRLALSHPAMREEVVFESQPPDFLSEIPR